MYEIEKDFGANKDKVTIKLAGKNGGFFESPYTFSGEFDKQIVAKNLHRGYALVTSPTGDDICYRVNWDGIF